CYAIEGLLGSYEAVGAEQYLTGARRAADSLVERVDEDGRISGRLDHEWQPQAPWNCLTGNAQLAGVLLRLHRITEDAR
ncbi:MAG: hypothetical protein GWN83_21245, partial [Gemmatimonadetes bacterium]|nr:hypothetical protein [Gemmatimonadota bacterium]